MSMTNKQQLELLLLRQFGAAFVLVRRLSPQAIRQYFDWSDKGIVPSRPSIGFRALRQAKLYRDYHITSYRSDIAEGLFTVEEIVSSYPKQLQALVTRRLV